MQRLTGGDVLEVMQFQVARCRLGRVERYPIAARLVSGLPNRQRCSALQQIDGDVVRTVRTRDNRFGWRGPFNGEIRASHRDATLVQDGTGDPI